MRTDWLQSLPMENAVIIRVASTLTDRLRTAYTRATTVQTLRAVTGETVRPDTGTDAGARTAVEDGPGGESEQKDAGDSGTDPTGRATADTADTAPNADSRSQTVPIQTAVAYRVAGAIRTRVRSAWLYQWLTSEPDPDVIVIDLRETRIVGPVLRLLETVITQGQPAASTSRLTGIFVGLQRRGRARPIRTVSLLVTGAVLALLLLLLLTGGSSGASILTLLGVLVVALRGTQNTQSAEAVRETRWFSFLRRAFTPPEPPRQPDRDDDKKR